MKKKIIIKIVAVVLLFVTVVTGGIFFIPNQEVEAGNEYRLCKHSTLYIDKHLAYDDSGFVYQVSLKTNQAGGYYHGHAISWCRDKANCREARNETLATNNLMKATYGCIYSDGIKSPSQYWTTRSNSQIVTRYRWSKKTTETSDITYGHFACSECKIYKATGSDTVTFKLSCCDKTVTVYANKQTYKVS